ncbi:MAG TPA: type II secretion system protein GspM, partial [Solirubrobacteraceae bacterium]
MTGRDRLVLVAISALAVLGAVWLLLVSPERNKASKLGSEVAAASTQLAAAEAQASDARAAQQRYSAAYSAVVSLGKAVPASEEVPSLIYQ